MASQGHTDQTIPLLLKNLENKDCTIKLLISKENITEGYPIYNAEDIMEGFSVHDDSEDESIPHPIEQMQTEVCLCLLIILILCI